MSLSKPQIIATAACPVCCAPTGTPCTFIRAHDPHGHRMAARQSHLPRMQKARKITAEAKSALATIRITL